MKYFVVSDVHSHYTLMLKALKEAGFDANNANHKIILCGDAFDRGEETIQMYNYLKRMIKRNKLIYILGNHEDLLVDMLYSLNVRFTDITNGTFKTAVALASSYYKVDMSNASTYEVCHGAYKTNITRFITENAINYFETKHYIFTHGYLPLNASCDRVLPNFRKAKNASWKEARWLNGMAMCMIRHARLKSKTIVCGHYHCAYGNARAKFNWDENKENLAVDDEFNDMNNFNIFYGVGVIGLDACTVFSKKVNCLVIEDEEV